MGTYKQFAESFAKDAGKIMLNDFGLGMKREWKEDNTPVTATDIAINSLLIEKVRLNFPNHGVLAEEESNIDETHEYVWVCDPVDGTIPFSHGIPVSSFSLALTKNGESILGVVYDPFQDRLFVAEKGGGAFMNGRPIQVSGANKMEEIVACYELFHNENYDIAKLVDYLRFEAKIKLMTLASIIYSTSLVAAGEIAFTIFPSDHAHDAAAIKVIVEEAGGKVTDLWGNDQRYDQKTKGFIASNGLLHDELVALSKEFVDSTPVYQ